MDILETVLQALDIPGPARAVYIDVAAHGSSTARMIAVRLGMTRPSVYDQVKILLDRGVLAERDMDGKAEFAIRDLADVERLLVQKKEDLADIAETFAKEKDRLLHTTKSIAPKIVFMSGREAIVRAMHDMLWDERMVLKAVWPYDEMLGVLGEEDLVSFNKKRIRNGLKLHSIWTGVPRKGMASIWHNENTDVLRRYAPKGFVPEMAYTVYGDKVLFVSSAREAFGFVVHSASFAQLMSLQFDVLWGVSKEAGKKQ